MLRSDVAIKVISLPHSERRAMIVQQFADLGLDWQFFDALDTPPADIPYDRAKARRLHGRELSPGELGCFASHRALWHMVAESASLKTMLILEDDVLLDPHFFSQFEVVAEAAARYPYLRLYAKCPGDIWREGQFLDRYVARFGGRAYGTQAYFITQAGARQFLRSIKEVVRPVDDEMDRFWAHGIPNRAVFPFPVLEIDRGSTLTPERSALPVISFGEELRCQATRLVEKVRREFTARLHRTQGACRM